MKSRLPHFIFGFILVASVMTNVTASDIPADADSIEQGVIRAAQSHGLVLGEDAVAAKGPVRTLVFRDPGCREPVLITLLSVLFEEEPVVRAIHKAHPGTRYIYLDRSWNAPHRLAVFFEWKKNKVLAMFGLTEYLPSHYMLVVDAPPACGVAETIDWRVVWNRAYLADLGSNLTKEKPSD